MNSRIIFLSPVALLSNVSQGVASVAPRGLVSYSHDVLAPNAKLRCEIIPSPPEHATEPSTDHAHAQGALARMSWARLLKRVFDIDHCPNCGGTLKVIAAPSTRLRIGIEDPPVILRVLTPLGLPTRAPSRSPARRFDPFQAV